MGICERCGESNTGQCACERRADQEWENTKNLADMCDKLDKIIELLEEMKECQTRTVLNVKKE